MKNNSRLLRLAACLLLILTLSVSLLTACKKGVEPEDDGPAAVDEFGTVLRFAVTSDVHLRTTTNDYNSHNQLNSFINSAYAYSDAQIYSALDAMLFIGDYTQHGSKAEQTEFYSILAEKTREDTYVRAVMGNHEFYSTKVDGSNYSPGAIAAAQANYLEYSGYESVNVHFEISGYHFIMISSDAYDKTNKIYQTEETLAWLEGELAAASAADPTGRKPIFVFQHEPPHNSYMHGFGGGDANLSAVLNKYPQVVDFSGHTHRPISDPQSVWQDGFTAVGTGGLAYLGLTIAGHPNYDDSSVRATDALGSYYPIASEKLERNAGMYYIVEVGEGNKVRLLRYNLFTDSLYGDPIVFTVGDPDEFTLTPDRAESAGAPAFADGSAIEVTSSAHNDPVIKFPQATAGSEAQNYRVEAWAEGAARAALTVYRIAGMHYGDARPSEISASLLGLSAATTYTVKVYPVDCWANVGEPLIGTITVGESSLEPDILGTVFNEDGSATNSKDGAALKKIGLGTTEYNEELGMYVAVLSGKQGYAFDGIRDYYERFVHAFSIEATFMVDALPEASCAIAGNMQSAGFGLTLTTDGCVKLNYRAENGSTSSYIVASTAPGTVKAGEWINVVGVFDGSYFRLYVNGNSAMIYDNEGTTLVGSRLSLGKLLFVAPTGAARRFMVGGDVNGSGILESSFVGRIAEINIYSRTLSASEVAEICPPSLKDTSFPTLKPAFPTDKLPSDSILNRDEIFSGILPDALKKEEKSDQLSDI